MFRNFIAFVFFTLLLGACAQTYGTDVTRFHELSQPSGETFIIVARDEDKKGSLELKSYARIVSGYLRDEGFVPAGEGSPDIIVKIDYAVSPPIEEGGRGNGPYYGGFFHHGIWYGHGRWDNYDYSFPIVLRRGYGGYSYYGRGGSTLVYDRVFEMEIEKNADGILFEGTASSIGREKDLIKIMPVLIEAMFTEFPGESGATQHVRVPYAENGT